MLATAVCRIAEPEARSGRVQIDHEAPCIRARGGEGERGDADRAGEVHGDGLVGSLLDRWFDRGNLVTLNAIDRNPGGRGVLEGHRDMKVVGLGDDHRGQAAAVDVEDQPSVAGDRGAWPNTDDGAADDTVSEV